MPREGFIAECVSAFTVRLVDDMSRLCKNMEGMYIIRKEGLSCRYLISNSLVAQSLPLLYSTMQVLL